ncbi:hypothetical protein NDU88_007318 [Pleurodeles waltl]|uniref:Uncharacterized protein n=1 Tax=Pleurodeles waltl TaxID=8319 RepID=A0AAV7N343_PLEWA|nr:hypothetical protein NDU88_007318 [Pleurodeles waltl]
MKSAMASLKEARGVQRRGGVFGGGGDADGVFEDDGDTSSYLVGAVFSGDLVAFGDGGSDVWSRGGVHPCLRDEGDVRGCGVQEVPKFNGVLVDGTSVDQDALEVVDGAWACGRGSCVVEDAFAGVAGEGSMGAFGRGRRVREGDEEGAGGQARGKKTKEVEEPKTGEQKTEEQKTEEQKTEEQKTEEQKTEEQKNRRTEEQKTGRAEEQKTEAQKIGRAEEQRRTEKNTEEHRRTEKKNTEAPRRTEKKNTEDRKNTEEQKGRTEEHRRRLQRGGEEEETERRKRSRSRREGEWRGAGRGAGRRGVLTVRWVSGTQELGNLEELQRQGERPTLGSRVATTVAQRPP